MRGCSLDSCRPRETSAILYTADSELTRNWFAFNTKRRWVEKRWVKEYKERGENRCAYDCCGC
jgi:hypothetical protein